MLEQPDVACGEGRRREPYHLPEREIPRHDREHDAEWLERHIATLAFDVDDLVSEKVRGVIRVEIAGGRAFLCFVDRRANGLSHLERHEPPVLDGALLEQLTRASDDGRA